MFGNEKGLTLLEIMVTMVITALLGLAINNISKMAIDAWQKGEARNQVYQNIRIAMDRMSDEICSAITLKPEYNLGVDGEPDTSDDPDIYFNGTSTQMDFIAAAHAPIGNYYDSDFDSGELVFDCCEIGYFISGTTLYRRKQEINVPDGEITTGGATHELATHITDLSLTYYSADGSSHTSWDSSTIFVLPTKVEIGLTAKSDSTRYPNERSFATWVYLPAR